ncbi:MAG: cytochrome c3 family protein [Thermoanaerobaculia bacterium]
MRNKFIPIAAAVLLTAALTTGTAHAQGNAGQAGSETCRGCHEELFFRYEKNVHSGTGAQKRLPGRIGCESCHGAGAAHAEDPSVKTGLIPFTPGDESQSIKACLACHVADRMVGGFERASHGRHRVACHSCHASPHADTSREPRRDLVYGGEMAPGIGSNLKRDGVELCLECHAEQRGRFSMPYRHPVTERAVACVSCHNPHKDQDSNARRRNSLCLSCHEDKRGPWPYEHAPVAEDCTSCHEVHGSVSPGLLKTAQPFLCLSCHSLSDDRHGAEIGGTQFSSAIYGRCTSCHGAIHGSHEDRHLKK